MSLEDDEDATGAPGGEAPGGEPVNSEPVNKRYRRYHNNEFHDKLLVSVMIVVKAFGRKDLPYVHWMLLHEWHIQIKDEIRHPRPKGFELYSIAQSFCCFKNPAEWLACELLGKGRGKVPAGDVPTLTTHYQDWSAGKFAKWMEIAREMTNEIQPEYVSELHLFPVYTSTAFFLYLLMCFAGEIVQKKTVAVRCKSR